MVLNILKIKGTIQIWNYIFNPIDTISGFPARKLLDWPLLRRSKNS
jgi:hypothetical protein